MKKIWVIALNSLREFIRDKIVLVTAFVAILLILFSLLMGSMSFGEQQRIVAHFGLAAIHLAGLGVVLFLGSFVISRELERQTCLLVMARPVDRSQFVLGKFLGVLLLNTLIVFILAAVLYTILGFSFPFTHYAEVIYGIWLEHAVLLALALFLSTSLRPSISLFACLSVFLAGNWLDEVMFFVHKYKIETFSWSTDLLEKIIPNLYQMNWRSVYFLEKSVPDSQLGWVLLHGGGWLMLYLSLACFVFRRKDLV